MFKNPMINYEAEVVLKSFDRTDVRRYKLRVTSYPRPVKALIEMIGPARELIMQEIPIINNTDRDWHIKISLQGSEDRFSGYFYVQNPPAERGVAPSGKDIRDFLIKKKTTGNIPILFFPHWVCQAEAKLVLQNNLTNDNFEYDLRGIGEEPLAEDHLVINCRARETTVREITITNPNFEKGVTYNVETDLIGASGPSQLVIPPKKKKVTYPLSITPTLSGQYTGSITFTDPEGHYVWWTVFLNTDSPPASKVIELTAGLRKAVACDIGNSEASPR